MPLTYYVLDRLLFSLVNLIKRGNCEYIFGGHPVLFLLSTIARCSVDGLKHSLSALTLKMERQQHPNGQLGVPKYQMFAGFSLECAIFLK